MSRCPKLQVSPAAALLLGLVFFFDDSGLASAVVPAALVHELGHAAMLRAFHRRITRLRLGLAGLEMDYAPRLEGARSLLCAAAGPLAGGIYAILACSLGGDFWQVSGAASFLLTVFNLLPIAPLDGGRVLLALLPEAAARRVSLVAAAALLAGGGLVFAQFRAAALLLAALWLVIWNCSCFFHRPDIE